MKDVDTQKMTERTVSGRQVILFGALWAMFILGGLYLIIQLAFWH